MSDCYLCKEKLGVFGGGYWLEEGLGVSGKMPHEICSKCYDKVVKIRKGSELTYQEIVNDSRIPEDAKQVIGQVWNKEQELKKEKRAEQEYEFAPKNKSDKKQIDTSNSSISNDEIIKLLHGMADNIHTIKSIMMVYFLCTLIAVIFIICSMIH